jgi:signal transduction histidine kinase
LEREVEGFANSTNDYAVWDDTLDFVQNLTPTYISDNLSSATFVTFQINYIVFADTTGQVVFSSGIEPSDESEIPVPADVLEYVTQTPLLYQFASVDDRVKGFVVLSEGVAVIAAAPIRTSANTEPIGGSLIWIRMLNNAEMALLADRTQLSLDLHAINDPQLPPDFRSPIDSLSANNPTIIRPLADDRSAGYTILNDIDGNPSLILRVDTARSIFQHGQQSTLFFVVVLVILGLAAIATTLILVEKLVLARLAKFSADVGRISQTSLSERVSVTGDDELAAVELEVNNMLGRIEAAQEELRAAKDAAEQSNRAKSIFLANMSHELRTPLNAIMGFLSIILMNAKLDRKDAYRAQRAYANSERLLNTINDILDISRIEAGRLQIVMMPVSVRDTVESIRSQMEVLAEEKTLPVELQVTENVPTLIETDGDALTKIITNLLSNGIKFTEKGKVSLLVDSLDNQLIIKVTDTGIGIAPHMYDLIFETFRQVDDSTTRPYGGVGLGLAIVQNLCKVMQGTVRVESELGRGSTFTVIIPFARVGEEVV